MLRGFFACGCGCGFPCDALCLRLQGDWTRSELTEAIYLVDLRKSFERLRLARVCGKVGSTDQSPFEAYSAMSSFCENVDYLFVHRQDLHFTINSFLIQIGVVTLFISIVG